MTLTLYVLFIYLHCILGLAFSACEALPSNAVGGAIQIFAVIVINCNQTAPAESQLQHNALPSLFRRVS